MIRITLLLLLLSLGITGFCSTPIDSLKVKISQIEKVDHKRIDSLQRELQFYKVKEDYYSTAVDRQGSHFEFLFNVLLAIIGFIITIGGFVSFKFIDKKIKSVETKWKNNLQKQENTNNNFLLEMHEIKANMYFQIGLSISSHTYASRDILSPIDKTNSYFAAMTNIMEAYVFEKDLDNRQTIKNALVVLASNTLGSLNHSLAYIESKTNKNEKSVAINEAKQSVNLIKKRYLTLLRQVDDTDFQAVSTEVLAHIHKINNIKE